MTLKMRRLLYISFIILFLTITPLIIFYAAGYKFNLRGIKIQKTGTFILDSKPQEAKIFLNNKVQQTFFNKFFFSKNNIIKTPAKIKNLLPGEYNLKLELDGYWPWQKKLIIYPGTSTYAEDIVLFKKNLPALILQDKINGLKLSVNKNNLAILTDQEVILLNLTEEKQVKLPSASSSPTINCAWAPSDKKILLNHSIYQTDNPSKNINLNDYIKTDIDNLKWDITSDDNLYYQAQDNFINFTLSNKANKIILENQKFNDYLVKDNYLYLVSQASNSTNLNIFTLGASELIRSISLPRSSEYEFINPAHQLINLYDKKHQILYLIDPFASFYSPVREIINNVKYANWVDNNRLIYANDFEIWFYEVNLNKKTLLTRISQGITNVFWHPSNNYIIYSTDKAINILELDQREKRSIIELIKFDWIKWPLLNKKGDILYFYAKIGNQEGLYKLAIQ